MNRTVVIEQIHLTVRVPANLPDPDALDIRPALAGVGFVGRIRQAIREAIRADPTLAPVRITITH